MPQFFANPDEKPTRRQVLLTSLATPAVVSLAACGSKITSASAGKVYRMGDRATAGQLIYTVLETEWLSALGTRVPTNKFLSIRLTISNSGNTERAIPLLTLIDAKGRETLETSDGAGLDGWLGMLRSLAATETAEGKLLFDVPQDSYKLQVTDGGDPENEITALIDIPLQIQEKTRITAPGGETVAPDPGATGH